MNMFFKKFFFSFKPKNRKDENNKYTIVGFNLIKVGSLKKMVRPPKIKTKKEVIKRGVETFFKCK